MGHRRWDDEIGGIDPFRTLDVAIEGSSSLILGKPRSVRSIDVAHG